MKTAANVLLFNICWFGTAYGVRQSMPELGPTVAVMVLLIHCLIILPSWREGLFIVIAGTTGYSVDSVLTVLGILTFETSGTLAPVWLLFQWFVFASLFHVSLTWLRNRYQLAALLGALGGPMTYYSAGGLNVLSLGSPQWFSLVVLGVVWALIVPGFDWLGQRPILDGTAGETVTS